MNLLKVLIFKFHSFKPLFQLLFRFYSLSQLLFELL